MFHFGSLFSGIGGLDLGLERAGMKCAWQVEIDDYCQSVLRKHWPHVPKWKDIKEFNNPNIEVDMICGGFPCQDISGAGKRVGIHGEKSGLFFELMRVVGEVKPRWVLLENVSDLLHRGLGDVLRELAQIGYDAEWHCIPAASVGAPHIRDRIFILGNANCNGQSRVTVNDETAGVSEMVPYSKGIRQSTWGDGIDDGTIGESKNTQRLRNKPDRCGWWKVEPGVGRVANGIPRRMDRIRGLGNAVVPQVAEFIGKQILEFDVIHSKRDIL